MLEQAVADGNAVRLAAPREPRAARHGSRRSGRQPVRKMRHRDAGLQLRTLTARIRNAEILHSPFRYDVNAAQLFRMLGNFADKNIEQPILLRRYGTDLLALLPNAHNGDMDAAVEFLRKNGQAKAEKKASRIAAEGVARAAISADGKTACVIEVNSETDFVAKNETFTSFVEAVNAAALASDLQGGKDGEDIEALLAVPFEGATVKDALVEKTATIGEKLSIRRFEKVAGDVAVSYIHGGGRIGVIVAANGASDDAAREALTNIAMQVAAMNPTYISRNDISAEELAKLQEITVDAALNDPASLPKPILNKLIDKAMNSSAWSDEDKAIYEEKKSNMNYLFNFLSKEAAAALAELAMADKDAIVSDKIFKGLADGRVSKQLKEICLLDQTYVKAEDGKQTVAKYLESVNKALTIAKVVRFEVGEGMEKKNEDFAAEVAAQMGN